MYTILFFFAIAVSVVLWAFGGKSSYAIIGLIFVVLTLIGLISLIKTTNITYLILSLLIMGLIWGFIKGVERLMVNGKKGLGITLLIAVPMLTVFVLFATLLKW